ncbi:MAG: PAS domain-containing protein [Deltaproteobacteria bacterium]|nr:PAS domain-containing protein [Deltaproteobacteria bacterium]
MIPELFTGTQSRYFIKPFLAALAVLWLALCCVPSAAEANGSKKVLILHSYHQGYLWTDMIQEGFSRTLNMQFPKVEIYTEYMNTKRQTAVVMSPQLRVMYRHLYSNVKFDVIVASDNNALDFLLTYRETLFPAVPVVFCGINDFFKYHLEPDQNYTGVREDLDIAPTIAVGLKLHPATKKIALITDATETGLINLGLVRKVTGKFPSLQFIELHALTAAQLSEKLKQLEDDTIVLALAFFRDPEGKTFSARESMEFILAASNRPVYTVWDFYMTSGTVGGKLLSGRLQGENAAKLVGRILNGEKAGAIPVIESPTAYMFDYAGLQKFGISESLLPEGSQVTGKPDTFYSRYGNYLWSGIGLFTIQVVIIGLLWWNIARRRQEESARSKAEQTSRESNDMFTLFMRHSPVYVFIKEVSQAGSRVLQASENFEEMVGIAGSEMIGKTMEELFPPEFAAKISADDRAVIAKGDVLKIDEELNGRSYTTIKFPLVKGDKTLLAGFTIDITERKQAEEALQSSQAFLNSILENIPNMIFVKDAGELRFVMFNRAGEELLGIPRDELIGKNDYDLFPLHEADFFTSRDQEVLTGGSILDIPEEPIETRKGPRLLHTKKIAILDPVGTPKYLVGISEDITDQKRSDEERQSLERQILHAQKLESLGVLAGGIAHDFNNLLMAIMGNADLALMRLNPESPAVENLHRIEQASARAADLAKQMLAYSGKGKFVVEHLDMSRLVEEMLHMLEVSITKKAVLRFNLMQPIPSVEADATQMRQIIMNLVINASEAIGDKSGVIAITTGCMDCDRNYLKDVWLDENLLGGLYVYLEIADSGCGMDKDTLSKLFDPFFTTKFTGRGLGMAAVLGIVRGHKGAIKVYSEPNKGTTFKILLPASDRPAELFNGHTHADDWQGSGKVLLVDDEETVRGIGREMLQELGFTVITADDGREGVSAFKENPDIAFVILDLTMPHMDGEQCFRELRQLKPDVKVIMSSGYSEQEVSEKFIGKGLAGFIQKPYKLSVLKKAVRNIS